MLTVLTHQPSPALQNCELTFIESKTIDIDKARAQHKKYCEMLESCGAQVITLSDNISSPDSVFIEDPVIVFDEIAIMTSMGVESRRGESEAIQNYFSNYREISRIHLPAKIEGGDVLKIDKRVYVGRSPRTNDLGITALADIIQPFGYEVVPVDIHGCLHLKTGCTALNSNTILLNRDWVESKPFQQFKIIHTPDEEPFGANVLPIHNTICMNEAFPQTVEMVRSLGYKVATTDISEFVKAEAGLTCMCVPFLTHKTETT